MPAIARSIAVKLHHVAAFRKAAFHVVVDS